MARLKRLLQGYHAPIRLRTSPQLIHLAAGDSSVSGTPTGLVGASFGSGSVLGVIVVGGVGVTQFTDRAGRQVRQQEAVGAVHAQVPADER